MRRLVSLAAIAISLCGALPVSAATFTGEEFAKDAKITLDDARIAALKVRKGEVIDQELEKEKGGSGLRYSFAIKINGKTYEVGVDAKTGKVLENRLEDKHPD
jgi:uncharacterized membrane protein YkoI